TLLRRAGTVTNTAFVATPDQQRTTPQVLRSIRGTEALPLVPDRNVHFLDLDLADGLVDRPCQVRIDLDFEVIHALQRLMVFLAEHHLALGRVELHALHRAD